MSNFDNPGGQHTINCFANLNDRGANGRFSNPKLMANRSVIVWGFQLLQANSNTLLEHYRFCGKAVAPGCSLMARCDIPVVVPQVPPLIFWPALTVAVTWPSSQTTLQSPAPSGARVLYQRTKECKQNQTFHLPRISWQPPRHRHASANLCCPPV